MYLRKELLQNNCKNIYILYMYLKMIQKQLSILNETIELSFLLFENVKNTPILIEKSNKENEELINKNQCYLLLNPEMILNIDHILHSIYRAYHNCMMKRRVTKNLILEIFFFLSSRDNITECLRECQINCTSSVLLLLGLNLTKTRIDSFVKFIEGDKISFDLLKKIHNKQKMLESFKCTDEDSLEKLIFHNIASKKIILA